MHYHSYDLPSAVTEEGLASMVCARVNESVKDYLSRASKLAEKLVEKLDGEAP